MADAETVDPNAQVSHAEHGRTLTGVGVDAEQLAETMERHAPPTPEPSKPSETVQPSTPEPAAPAEPSRGRKRFSDLTKERDAANERAAAKEAEAQAAIRERDELKARLSTPPSTPEPSKPAEVAKPTEVKPTRPEPSEEEIGTKYATYGEFARDVARWVVEQDRAQAAASDADRVRAVIASERQHESVMAKVQEARERGRKTYADFDTLLSSPTGAIDLGRTKAESVERVLFIAQHPQSEHIQYAILKDEALARKLQTSDPYTFGVTIAGLVAPQPSKAERNWTPPPSPHPTVGASSPTSSPSSAELAHKGDYDAYKRKRAAELGISVRRR